MQQQLPCLPRALRLVSMWRSSCLTSSFLSVELGLSLSLSLSLPVCLVSGGLEAAERSSAGPSSYRFLGKIQVYVHLVCSYWLKEMVFLFSLHLFPEILLSTFPFFCQSTAHFLSGGSIFFQNSSSLFLSSLFFLQSPFFTFVSRNSRLRFSSELFLSISTTAWEKKGKERERDREIKFLRIPRESHRMLNFFSLSFSFFPSFSFFLPFWGRQTNIGKDS